ncbi:MAG TPA: DUF1801 domain-containing protein [Pyrinomonadaceae bacterium]|nr:DUF1801 domain-containing protein [Pyrinomonadaceae bacterium]
MSEQKTKPTETNVEDFLNAVADEKVREDCRKIAGLMQKITGENPKMWGANIVGFGDYHYRYASGRNGDTFQVGFSPRKQNITFYLTDDTLSDEKLLSKLGKYKTGKSCLHFISLSDVDVDILEKIIETSVRKHK